MEQPKLLTVQEVARYLAVSRRTVYRMLKDHRLPAYRIGGQWRFKLEVIEDWMRRQGARKYGSGDNRDANQGAEDPMKAPARQFTMPESRIIGLRNQHTGEEVRV